MRGEISWVRITWRDRHVTPNLPIKDRGEPQTVRGVETLPGRSRNLAGSGGAAARQRVLTCHR